jgi:hypothetical protein
MKHHGRLSETPSDLGLYEGHSVAHERRALIGRATGGAVLDSGVVKLVGEGRHLLEDPEVGRLYLGVKSAANG